MRAEKQWMATKARERETLLVRRTWTRSERRVVLSGLLGRLLIAIEPCMCFAVFGALTAGLIFFPRPAGSPMTRWESAIVIAPIFGLAAAAFLAWAIAVLYAPVRALASTFKPIYIVDGYVRYRRPDRESEANSNGYIAVLSSDRDDVAEWPSLGHEPLVDGIRPALIEFSHFGGIHRIDGQSTGVMPEKITLAGVGMNRRR
jgi:hypothetical protein